MTKKKHSVPQYLDIELSAKISKFLWSRKHMPIMQRYAELVKHGYKASFVCFPKCQHASLISALGLLTHEEESAKEFLLPSGKGASKEQLNDVRALHKAKYIAHCLMREAEDFWGGYAIFRLPESNDCFVCLYQCG